MSDFINTTKSIQRHVGVTADGVFGPVTASAVWKALNADSDQGSVISDQQDDERTLENIATLDPKCREMFLHFTRLAKATAATMGCDYVLISGNRSYAEQDALYAQPWDGKDNDRDGKTDEADEKVTRAKGGYSNHNFGIAGDFGVFRGKAYLDNTDAAMAAKVHRACSVHAEACGLEWGGSWTGFKDLPHYEVRTGLSLAAKRKLMKEKGSVL